MSLEFSVETKISLLLTWLRYDMFVFGIGMYW